MIDLEDIDHIYLYPGSTDLRKGRQALSSLAAKIYNDNGLHELFLFCNRKNELIKIYEKDETGVWVYIRSLDETRLIIYICCTWLKKYILSKYFYHAFFYLNVN